MANAGNPIHDRPVILVVDDDPDLLQLFHDVLADECEYVVAPHGKQPPTLDEIRKIKPDVMIIDHRLGEGTTGWDLVRAVRGTSDLRQLPILFCTADHKQIEAVADDMELMRVTPLVKPFSVDQLVGDVAEALRIQGIDPNPCA